jgi:hypothetical protein
LLASDLLPDLLAVEERHFLCPGLFYERVFEDEPGQVVAISARVALFRAVEVPLDFGVVIRSLDAVAAVFEKAVSAHLITDSSE